MLLFLLIYNVAGAAEASHHSQRELVATLQARMEVMEREKRELTELNEQLQGEVNSVRRMASFRENAGQYHYCHTMITTNTLRAAYRYYK